MERGKWKILSRIKWVDRAVKANHEKRKILNY